MFVSLFDINFLFACSFICLFYFIRIRIQVSVSYLELILILNPVPDPDPDFNLHCTAQVMVDPERKLKAPLYVNGDSHKTLFSSSLVPGWLCRPVTKDATMSYHQEPVGFELPLLQQLGVLVGEGPGEGGSNKDKNPNPDVVEQASKVDDETTGTEEKVGTGTDDVDVGTETESQAKKRKLDTDETDDPEGASKKPKLMVHVNVPFLQPTKDLDNEEMTRGVCKNEFPEAVFQLGYRAICAANGSTALEKKQKLTKGQKRCQHLLR